MPPSPNSKLEKLAFALRSAGVKQSPNTQRAGIHTRGYLPHVKRVGAWYFVTFRLADSLPSEALKRFHAELATLNPELNLKRELRKRIEQYLDRGAGPAGSADPK